jgi:hypothetical protein
MFCHLQHRLRRTCSAVLLERVVQFGQFAIQPGAVVGVAPGVEQGLGEVFRGVLNE